ncbi:hypothetical protein, partial [Vulcanisaeta souniana]|uniref:hypothetical protein n=1 Tax=Vulcanisaeta souniana TaxID=164452 RepID=UPI001FB1CB05
DLLLMNKAIIHTSSPSLPLPYCFRTPTLFGPCRLFPGTVLASFGVVVLSLCQALDLASTGTALVKTLAKLISAFLKQYTYTALKLD